MCETGVAKIKKTIGLNLREYTENPQHQKLVWIAINNIKKKQDHYFYQEQSQLALHASEVLTL